MIENQEDDEFIAVRVQDPRVQNEGSWNSHVDYKIFLHTNSKSFTAKTSCVRRRYSEFVWLKKKLQKNSGLVPVPNLPHKSFFSFSNEDFLERRRTGLQSFLDKVLHMTVCLSDSQLHLFMQTQLPVRHIEDCVQGHTPYTVTDAILTYASSNRGFAQAQEEDLQKERGASVVSYESMESPAPHLPSQQTNGERDPLEAILETPGVPAAQRMVCHSEGSSLQVLQEDHHLEAVIQQHRPAAASFYLGSNHDERPPAPGSPPASVAPPTGRIQTSVEVHSPMGDAVTPDCRVETEAEEVLENGCLVAEECLADMQPTEEAVPRAPSVPADGVCTDSQEGEEEEEEEEGEKEKQEEEEEERVNGNGDSGDHTEAVCGATRLLDHVVSEQEEEEDDEEMEEEKKEKEVNSEQQVLKQTSRAEQELDLECHLSFEEPGVEPGSVSEEPLERHGGPPDGRVEDGPPQDEERGGEENGMVDLEMETSNETLHGVNDVSESECRADDAIEEGYAPLDQSQDSQEEDLERSVNTEPQDEDSRSSVSSDGIDPTIDPEEGIQNVKGHLEKSTEEVAPSTGVEDTSICDSQRTTHSTDNLIWSEEDDAQQETKGALELCQTTGDPGLGEAPELNASA